MRLDLKILLILVGLAYLISPLDIIPDYLLPFVGWIDDGVIIWAILHLIRHGKLPGFGQGTKSPGGPAPSGKGASGAQEPNPGAKEPNPGAQKFQETPHQILGVSPHASWEEIQAAYKAGIKKYHPDKLSHLGEEFSHLANEKFLKIQWAYDQLKDEQLKSKGSKKGPTP